MLWNTDTINIEILKESQENIRKVSMKKESIKVGEKVIVALDHEF